MPSRSVPPPPPTAAAVTPFWKSPLPVEERTAGDGLSYSRTTSVDDIRLKLQVTASAFSVFHCLCMIRFGKY